MLLKGTTKLYNAVKVSLGPGGRNVIIDYENDTKHPKITKDGVTIIKSIFLDNRIEELGSRLLKQVSHNTNKTCGDGTTTSAMLGHLIF
jgi:chaperonin GroEL